MKEIKLIFNSRIPRYLSIFISIGAITLWPFIIFRNPREEVSEVTINHEMIHIKQQKELLILGFYILYVYYWIKNLFKYRDSGKAYYNIPFEIEAYRNQSDFNYLDARRPQAWRSFVRDEIVS